MLIQVSFVIYEKSIVYGKEIELVMNFYDNPAGQNMKVSLWKLNIWRPGEDRDFWGFGVPRVRNFGY